MAEGEEFFIRDSLLHQMKNESMNFDDGFPFPDHFSSSMAGDFMGINELAGIDTSYMSFTQCLQAKIPIDFVKFPPIDASCSPEILNSGEIVYRPAPEAANRQNSSDSSSTIDAADEDSRQNRKSHAKGTEDGQENSKKGSKPIRREKKQKLPRFAFMTKTEVDHLEDGYRWRKYGQKAVKNSPYPRSYYRCTTQKCLVKKRVERSFQDPTVVITTYEGKHTHHSPASLRGSNGSGIMAMPSFSAMASYQFPAELPPIQIPKLINTVDSKFFMHSTNPLPQLQQHQVLPDYGLLQDIINRTFKDEA